MSGLKMVTLPPCLVCQKTGELWVDAEGLRKWKGGAFIQHAFPDMDAETRELMISGTHDECWDSLFPSESA